NDEASRERLVTLVRELAPRVVILPYPVGRHPDHRIASELARDACYLAGLAKYAPRPGVAPHRPFKILYALAYREDPVKPSFVVDISATFDAKMAAVRCYASQFDGAKAAGEIHPTGQDLYELIRLQSAHYGSLIRKPYVGRDGGRQPGGDRRGAGGARPRWSVPGGGVGDRAQGGPRRGARRDAPGRRGDHPAGRRVGAGRGGRARRRAAARRRDRQRDVG